MAVSSHRWSRTALDKVGRQAHGPTPIVSEERRQAETRPLSRGVKEPTATPSIWGQSATVPVKTPQPAGSVNDALWGHWGHRDTLEDFAPKQESQDKHHREEATRDAHRRGGPHSTLLDVQRMGGACTPRGTKPTMRFNRGLCGVQAFAE